MQIDFWQYSQGPVERIVALIATRVLAGGDRLLIVDGDAERRSATSQALWEAKPESFLANGDADGPHAARQPILLSDRYNPANGAKVAILADGDWRAPGSEFDRVIVLFARDQAAPLRAVWREFDSREDVTRGYFEQEAGKWIKRL
ncbi:MAG: DNA polymerase III subunit chi [Tsuneonella sp.]